MLDPYDRRIGRIEGRRVYDIVEGKRGARDYSRDEGRVERSRWRTRDRRRSKRDDLRYTQEDRTRNGHLHRSRRIRTRIALQRHIGREEALGRPNSKLA